MILRRSARLVSAACCLTLVLGCGSSSDDERAEPGQSAAGGASGAGGSPAAQAGNGNSASAGSASAGSAGASGPGGSGSGGGSNLLVAASLYPLAVGNRWTYQVTGADANCAAGSHDASVVGIVTQGGEQAFDFRDYCSDDFPRYLRSSADEIWEYQAEWARSLAQPLQDGYSWMFTAHYQLLWHSVGTVTVPAGTFNDCWQRTANSGDYTANRTYCPQVGPVKFSDSLGEQAALLSYSLE